MTAHRRRVADEASATSKASQDSSAYGRGQAQTAAYEAEMERLQDGWCCCSTGSRPRPEGAGDLRGRGSAGRAGDQRSPSAPRRARSGWSRCPSPPAAARPVRTSRGTSSTCRPPVRSCCSTGPAYNRSNIESVIGYLHRGGLPGSYRSCPELSGAGAVGIHVVVWFSVSSGAAQTLRGRDAGAAEALEAQRHDLADPAVVKYSMANATTFQYTDIEQARLVRRPVRRQEGCAAQLHRPPAQPSSEYVDVAPEEVELPVMQQSPTSAADARGRAFVPRLFKPFGG